MHSKEEYLFPFLNFLNKHRRSKRRSPFLTPATWKVPYFFGPNKPRTLQEREKYKEFKPWILDNQHYAQWLWQPESMYAPREYIIPELKKLLLVTPRYFAAHFFPSYSSDLLSDLSRYQIKRIRQTIPTEGLEYLMAHCHGVPTRLICNWSGKSEADIHKSVLNSVGSFANSVPYWIWAYRVDMRSVPFTQKKSSRCKFAKRLRIWNDLNERPQFTTCNTAKMLLPNYLHTPEALSSLPKKRVKKPIDTLLLSLSHHRNPPVRKLSRYKSF